MSSIRRNQPFADYVNSYGVNQSSLKTLVMKTPAHYFAQLNATEEKDTEALTLGSLLHVTTFEPAELLRWYVVQPAFETQIVDPKGQPYQKPRATKAYKELVAKFADANEGKTVVDSAQFEAVRGMFTNICKHERSRDYLSAGDAEVGVYWQDKETGIACKARFDKWNVDRRLIVDLKSTRDAQGFTKAIATYGYDFQAAWYTWAAECITGEPHDFAIIAAESVEPYGVRAAPVGRETLAIGRLKVREALNKLAECQASGDWPCYDDPDEWNLPAWAMIDDEPATLIINGKELAV